MRLRTVKPAPLPAGDLTTLQWGLALIFALIVAGGCKGECPPGRINVDGICRRPADAGVDGDATADADAVTAGTGTKASGTQAAGAGGSTKAPPKASDPVSWMCMRNPSGECTSCKHDNDCPKHVCQSGYCMDCRESSQCAAAESCISNRCVPERKPSGIWTVSGGGLTHADGMKLQVSVGSPSPAGNASASGFKLSLSPGSGLY